MKIYCIAGEPSGDLLGGHLLTSLTDRSRDVTFAGVGGAHMEKAGLTSLFPMEYLSIMGLVEIIPHIPKLLGLMNRVVDHIKTEKPDVIVTIDAPGFTYRIAKRVKSLEIPLMHITAPTVWAWRPGRAKIMAKIYDHLFCLFPFEPPYFEREGLATTFIGHPLVDALQQYRVPYNPQGPLCLLPGSRQAELKTMVPLFRQLLERHPALADRGVVLPTLAPLEMQIRKGFEGLEVDIITDLAAKYKAIAGSRLALAASGTVSLELGLLGTPMIVGYRAHPVTAWLLRRLVKIPHVCLANIILNQKIVPELMQEDCTLETFAETIENKELWQHQRVHLDKLGEHLRPRGTLKPLDHVACHILNNRCSA